MCASTLDQNTERPLDGIELDRVFTDKASGKDMTTHPLRFAAPTFHRLASRVD